MQVLPYRISDRTALYDRKVLQGVDMKRLLLVPALITALALPIRADERSELLRLYDDDFVRIQYNMLGGLQLGYRNYTFSVTYGLDSRLMDLLSGDADAQRYLDSYRSQNTGGHVLVWGGLALMLVGPLLLVPMIADTDYDQLSYMPLVSFGISTGALAAEIIGTFMLGSSYENLVKGVNLYNRNLLVKPR